MKVLIMAGIVILVLVYALWVFFSRESEAPKFVNANIDWVPGADDPVDTGVIERYDERINEIFIAGLAHHCKPSDCGIFGGRVFNEKDNPVDKKAMAIGSHQSGKIIGYVPGAILDNYRKWSGRKECRCVGYIYREEGQLKGRARVYSSDIDLQVYQDDATKYLEIICERFGWEIPSGNFKI